MEKLGCRCLACKELGMCEMKGVGSVATMHGGDP